MDRSQGEPAHDVIPNRNPPKFQSMKPIDFILGLLAVIVAAVCSFSGLFENLQVGQGFSLIASVAAIIGVTALAMKLRAGSLSRGVFNAFAVGCILAFGSLSAHASNRVVKDSGVFEFRWSTTSYQQHPFFKVIGRDGTNGFFVTSNGVPVINFGGTNHTCVRTNGLLTFLADS